LVYVRASDVTEHLSADAAIVGQVLGAHHVVVVDADNIRVIDVATHAVNTTIATNVPDLDTPIRLDARLRTAFSGTPTATLPTAEPPQRSAGSVAASGAGVWPWIVAGSGVALLGTGVVLNFMHNAEQSSLVAMCNDRGEQVVCPASLATRGDDIATLNTARVATLVAGSALVVGGVVWWLLDRPHARSTSACVHVVPLLSIESVGISGSF
jgi:hypothetical protein